MIFFLYGDLVPFTYFEFVICHVSIFMCRTHSFFIHFYTFTRLSSFIFASVSIERAIATNLIIFAKDYCKQKIAYRISLLNFLLATLFNSHYLYFLGYEVSHQDSVNKSSNYFLVCASKIRTTYDLFLDPYNQWLDLACYANGLFMKS